MPGFRDIWGICGLWHKDRDPVTGSYGLSRGPGDRDFVTACPWVRPLREDLVRPRTDHQRAAARVIVQHCLAGEEACYAAPSPAVPGLGRPRGPRGADTEPAPKPADGPARHPRDRGSVAPGP